jgi:predicted nucleic acid-binding protein
VIIVADSSPLIVLQAIDLIRLLPELFGEVVVPPEVLSELSAPARTEAVRRFSAAPPAWLKVRAPRKAASYIGLHAGEAAAIELAREVNASLLIIDETRGRKTAVDLGLRITGTIGIMVRGAEQGLVDLADAFARVKRTDFWVSRKLLDETLRSFKQRYPQP